MRRILLLLLLLPLALARDFSGSGNITFIEPTDTRLAICTPNEKYIFEAGSSQMLRLYVRNDMSDKDVKQVSVIPHADERFVFSFNPQVIENITATEYKYFDVNVMIPADMPSGAYRVEFHLGTDEYQEGSFIDEIQIRVLPYSGYLPYLFSGIIIAVIIMFTYRFIWIRKQNRLT
jgi:uncharacterized membrane protein